MQLVLSKGERVITRKLNTYEFQRVTTEWLTVEAADEEYARAWANHPQNNDWVVSDLRGAELVYVTEGTSTAEAVDPAA